jgi:phospholipase/carboxylesterase
MKHILDIKTAGAPLERAEKALIMIHGRGGSAQDILSLASHLHVDNYALVAHRLLIRRGILIHLWHL